MPQIDLEWLALITEQTSPQIKTHHTGNEDNEFDFDFFHSLLGSEKVEFQIRANDVEYYPRNHTFNFSLRSPSPHSGKDEDLLSHLSQIDTKGKPIKEIIKIAGLLLAVHSRYNAESFVVPDDRTILVAVLGSPNLSDDDWFASDFCLFHRALGGTAKKEVWLTCDSLQDFVKSNGPIIHGSPYHKPRQIVFDDTFPDFTILVDKARIASSFLGQLQDAARDAVPGDRIFVITVAHGCEGNGDQAIGSSYISRDMVELALVGIKDGVEIAIATTACYSGIWAIPFQNSRATVLAATTVEQPSYSFPTSDSGFSRGGYFAGTVVDEPSGLLQERLDTSNHSQHSSNSYRLLTKTVSVRDLNSKTIHSTPNGIFSSYANRVIEAVKQKQGVPAAISYSSSTTGIQQAAGILGGTDELSTLFRVGAVLELPKEASFSSIALAVGRFTPHRKTAGVHESPWAARARLLYEQLAQRSPGQSGRVDNIPITRYAKPVAAGTLPEEKCEELARRIWKRFQSDEQAQRIASVLGWTYGKDLPHIVNWDWDKHLWTSTAEHRSVLEAFHKHEPTYGKPSAFILWVAFECGATAEEFRATITGSLAFPTAAKATGISPSCSIKSLASMQALFNKEVVVK